MKKLLLTLAIASFSAFCYGQQAELWQSPSTVTTIRAASNTAIAVPAPELGPDWGGFAYQYGENRKLGPRITVFEDDVRLDGMGAGFFIRFWAKIPKVAPGTSNVLVSKMSFCTVGSDAYALRVDEAGRLFAQLSGATGFINAIGTRVVDDNQWHYITFVWDRPHVRLYVDGELDKEFLNAFDFPISDSPSKLVIGHPDIDNCGQQYSHGESIYLISVGRYALSSQVISNIYQSFEYRVTSNLKALKTSLVSYHPNPTKGLVNLSGQYNVQISDIAGKLVKEVSNVDQIDISAEPSGMYFLSILNDDGELLQRSKITKE